MPAIVNGQRMVVVRVNALSDSARIVREQPRRRALIKKRKKIGIMSRLRADLGADDPLESTPDDALFPGFETVSIDVGETTISARRAGTGPPVLLLHGFPETHLMWHRVAPALAEDFMVVCADLRGYGRSGKPPSRPDHSTYSKRSMALDMTRLMEALGVQRFFVAGHDRGGRVAHRMALDHPDRVARLAVLDIIPTSDVFRLADARLALAFWPWSLLTQPAPLPELLLGSAPEAVVDDALKNWGSRVEDFPDAVRTAYVNALRDAATIHAICEEYRASASIDLQHDDEDEMAERRVACPVLALWSVNGPIDMWYRDAGGPLAIWARRAGDVRGHAIPGGHFFPEGNASDTTSELRRFFQED